jgi:hypothetical protein
VVVVDHVIYLTVTDAMWDMVNRHKASARGGKFVSNRVAAQRAG